jgi:D-alanyl-D-alanine carboxypeptidase/D-alanyl-D-alanine-endopeptidase (penicillin-binding protein 4)
MSSYALALDTEVGPPSGPAIAAPAPLAPVLSARRIPALVAEPLGERRLVAALDGVWGPSPQPACIQVVDRDSVLYEQNPDGPVIPASTLKLVTATAVLYHMGPDARLQTIVRAAAPPNGGVLEGDLFLIGGGDPVLGTQPWAASFPRQPALVSPLEVLADRVVAAGVREVRGRVVGDEQRYDTLRAVPSWPARYRAAFETGPLSALTVNDGLAVFGGAPVAFPDPAAGAAAVLTELLRQRGVVVAGEGAAGAAPEGTDLAVLESPTMAEVVGAMLRESDNGTAELLLKEVGLRVAGEGSSAAGARVVTDTMRLLGLPMDGVVIADGSGLDRGNTVTCRFLTTLLRQAEAGGPLDAGLAVAGISGTLTSRVLGEEAGRIRAKTGSLNDVASLAGYAQTRAGSDLVFSYVLNGEACCEAARLLEDALADALIAFPDLPALDELGPEGAPQ